MSAIMAGAVDAVGKGEEVENVIGVGASPQRPLCAPLPTQVPLPRWRPKRRLARQAASHPDGEISGSQAAAAAVAGRPVAAPRFVLDCSFGVDDVEIAALSGEAAIDDHCAVAPQMDLGRSFDDQFDIPAVTEVVVGGADPELADIGASPCGSNVSRGCQAALLGAASRQHASTPHGLSPCGTNPRGTTAARLSSGPDWSRARSAGMLSHATQSPRSTSPVAPRRLWPQIVLLADSPSPQRDRQPDP